MTSFGFSAPLGSSDPDERLPTAPAPALVLDNEGGAFAIDLRTGARLDATDLSLAAADVRYVLLPGLDVPLVPCPERGAFVPLEEPCEGDERGS